MKELATDLERNNVKINGISEVTMKLIEGYHLRYSDRHHLRVLFPLESQMAGAMSKR